MSADFIAILKGPYDGFRYAGLGFSDSSALACGLCEAAARVGRIDNLRSHLGPLLSNMVYAAAEKLTETSVFDWMVDHGYAAADGDTISNMLESLVDQIQTREADRRARAVHRAHH